MTSLVTSTGAVGTGEVTAGTSGVTLSIDSLGVTSNDSDSGEFVDLTDRM